MLTRISIFAALLVLLLSSGCSTIVTALLVRELLDDAAPKRKWSGRVTSSSGEPVGGIKVEVLGEVEGDSDIAKFSDETDTDGEYDIEFRWAKEISYAIRVTNDGVVAAEVDEGKVENEDQVTDFVIQSATSTELSGVVRGPSGLPLADVLIIAGSVSTLEGNPTIILDDEGDPQYRLTSSSGVYQIEGGVSRYGVVCAYHPSHGFAYAFGEDSNSDGSIPLDLQMGASGSYEVRAQVQDALGVNQANQILPPARQFRMRLESPFNFGSTVDEVVDSEGLFSGLVGEPSDSHPDSHTLTVQLTGANGISQSVIDVPGGNYEITLLETATDDPATALVQGSTTLVLSDDATVVVRVN